MCSRTSKLNHALIMHAVKSEVAITGRSSLEELDTLTLQCTAIPSASISWLKRSIDGIKLLISSPRISISTEETAIDGKMATLGTLTITDVNEIDGGDYVCEAQNGVDSIPAAEEINVSINGEYLQTLLYT